MLLQKHISGAFMVNLVHLGQCRILSFLFLFCVSVYVPLFLWLRILWLSPSTFTCMPFSFFLEKLYKEETLGWLPLTSLINWIVLWNLVNVVHYNSDLTHFITTDVEDCLWCSWSYKLNLFLSWNLNTCMLFKKKLVLTFSELLLAHTCCHDTAFCKLWWE